MHLFDQKYYKIRRFGMSGLSFYILVTEKKNCMCSEHPFFKPWFKKWKAIF